MLTIEELSVKIEPNATMHFIEALDEKYDNAIPIFGGAIWINPTDIDRIIDNLPTIIRRAKFFGWHAGPADACRIFCHCLFVNPALIECCIGMKFEELVA